MPPTNPINLESVYQWIVVRPEPAGQFRAQLLGLPELSATAANREEAIQQIRALILEWIALGQLVPVEVPAGNPLLRWFGHIDPNDPAEKIYLEELARFRQEDLERTLRELDQECSSSSSTPTT